MTESDNDFFILVLGVLAAIIATISWWYLATGPSVASETTANPPPVTSTVVPSPTPTPSTSATSSPPIVGPTPTTEEPDPAPIPTQAGTVFDAILAEPDLAVLADLLRAEGFDETLVASGPFTVIAPTDDALAAAAGSDTTVAILDAARAEVLAHHIIVGRSTRTELDAGKIQTLQGESVTVSLDDDGIVVDGTTRLRPEPIRTENGWVYVADNVVLPPIASLNALVDAAPILFGPGSVTIEAGSFETLDRFVEVLSASNVAVVIEGHTDSSGDPILNQDLSEGRARAVRNYLVANGIDEARLSVRGLGSTQPVADNDSETGRARNRRIEFVPR